MAEVVVVVVSAAVAVAVAVAVAAIVVVMVGAVGEVRLTVTGLLQPWQRYPISVG